MRNALQGAAAAILLAVALLADGLMGALGPLDFLLIAGMAVAVAGALVWLSNRHRKKKAAHGAATSESGKADKKNQLSASYFNGMRREKQV